MPTLTKIPTPPKGATEKSTTAGDDCCMDDRFSQPPNYVTTQTRLKKGKLALKSACDVDNSEIAQFSVASALRKHHRNDKDNNCSNASDIVAVVLSTAIRQAPNTMASHSKPSKSSSNSRIHLLVGDQTLPQGECARVYMSVDGMGGVLERSNSISSPLKENAQVIAGLGQLQPGDVVRWNRLEVRNDYDDEEEVTTAKKRKLSDNNTDEPLNLHRPLLRVKCDLSLSWIDPAAGPSLARLCRITPRQSSMQRQQQEDGYDLEWEHIIHPSMETPKETVVALARWYSANAGPHFSKPCKRRKLRDITAPNTLSHVVVNVIRCEKAFSPYSTPRAKDPVVTHVTLSDGAESDDILGMSGGSLIQGRISGAMSSLPKSISAVLMQSMKEGTHVLLTHVLSQNINPVGGGASSLQGRESLVLVPTRETTAATLTPEHPYYVHEKSLPEKTSPESQPLTLERASQLYSMTQQHSPPGARDKARRGVMAVVAPLVDIIVDGMDTSFVEGSHWQSPQKLSRFLIDCPSVSTGMDVKMRPSFRSATLVLDPKLVSSEIVVNADENAMKLLCMDVPVEDMIHHSSWRSSITPNPYLCHVGELLKALCTEGANIRWVLEQESERNWFVTNATLLEI